MKRDSNSVKIKCPARYVNNVWKYDLLFGLSRRRRTSQLDRRTHGARWLTPYSFPRRPLTRAWAIVHRDTLGAKLVISS